MLSSNNRLLPLFNLIGLILTLVMNYLSTALPLAGRTPGGVSDAFPNLFAPAGFTFAIWGIIYLLLIGFIVYQIRYLNRTEKPVFLSKIGWLFVVSCLANSLWLLAWHHLHIGLAMLIMLIILGSLLMIYLKLDIGRGSPTTGIKWLVHLPFSIYLGWITVATIANTTILLVSLGWDGQPGGEAFWAAVTIAAAVGVNLWALVSRKDIGFGMVGLWALYGIHQKRITDLTAADGLVETAAFVGMLMIAAGILYAGIKRLSGK